uniref:Family with sequence similarity 207 member A n=1 Tax=Calidris pygmaea TaxID=425635 RepID=A0A8C3JS33_9CHAR
SPGPQPRRKHSSPPPQRYLPAEPARAGASPGRERRGRPGPAPFRPAPPRRPPWWGRPSARGSIAPLPGPGPPGIRCSSPAPASAWPPARAAGARRPARYRRRVGSGARRRHVGRAGLPLPRAGGGGAGAGGGAALAAALRSLRDRALLGLPSSGGAPEPARGLSGARDPRGASPQRPDWGLSSSGVFSGLKIDLDTLVKKLDLDSRTIISSGRGLEEKTVLSKKEKMKLRKERWLQKIESVKLAKQKQKAEAKRKATPVVGDMQPLMEALPELSDLTTGGRSRKLPKSHVEAKAEPEDFCLMKQAQKCRLLEEEVARFHEVIANPSYRANPLMTVSEHLSKRLRQEEEGKPL